jgi:hypothetical protein
MPSRLSSLLVRDGVVGVKLLERAFQRQVIYGGSLDTNLLEMKAATEDQLLQYASLATGIPPATRSDLERLDPAVAERCPEAVAREHGVVPLLLDQGALQLLVRDPLELSSLEGVAAALEVPVKPLLVLEYRFHVALGRLFGREVEPRFATLAARVAREAPPASATMRPESVVVGSPALKPEPDAPKRRRARKRPVSKPPADRASGEVVEAATSTKATEVMQAIEIEAEPSSAAPSTPPAEHATSDVSKEPSSGAPDESLAPEDARLQLQSAAHRDDVFLLLLRALRSQTSYAALLTVQGGAAIGRVALASDPALAATIREVLIPLDVRSAFRQAIESGAPYIGPIATGDAEVDAMIERLGGCVPPAGVLLPITLRGRAVAVAFGHRGREAIGISEVAGVLPVAGAAADALHRLIMSRKAASPREDAPGVPEPVADDPPTSRIPASRNNDATPKTAAMADTLPADVVTSDALTADDRLEPVEALLVASARGDEEAARHALERALAVPAATVAALSKRFPGPLEFDRHGLGGRLRPAREHGPLLALLVRLGGAASPLIVGELQADEPAHRYYAALCAGAVQPPAALNALVDCLFDADSGVRGAAIEALASYPPRERDGALTRVREVLAEIDEARVGAAADACADLGHTAAIPALIEALSHETAPAPVRRALVALTKQDFGGSSRKWRSWWTKNRDRSRLEWMIDGLNHKEAEVRRSAIEELRRVTGEYFGYHHDLPRKERTEAQKRWSRWLRETKSSKIAELATERRSTVLVASDDGAAGGSPTT